MFNKIIILGNLGKDPELKTIREDLTVATFSIASSRKYKGQEEVEWFAVEVFGAQANSVAEFLRKGSRALVEGRIKTDKFTGKDGVEKYRTKVIAENVRFLDGKKNDNGQEDIPY